MRIKNFLLSFAGETKLEVFTNCDLFEVAGQLRRGLFLWKECLKLFVTEEEKRVYNYFSTWSSYFWEMLQNKKAQQLYGFKLCQFTPTEWRRWWIDISTFSAITIYNPPSYFIDSSSHITDLKNVIKSYKISRLMTTCNKFRIPDIFCP